ncbi:hypothetical protein NL676_012188 [Syzygium grande]|nr:hypothetical protein NL676_012188 [Syzygium grande]
MIGRDRPSPESGKASLASHWQGWLADAGQAADPARRRGSTRQRRGGSTRRGFFFFLNFARCGLPRNGQAARRRIRPAPQSWP